jgi:replicative DNA helicase
MDPELAKWEMFAKEILRRILAEEDPETLQDWMLGVLKATNKPADTAAFLAWLDTFDFYEGVLAERATESAKPLSERRLLDWPWSSWQRLIRPLRGGMLAVITAPDGQGKTMYAECIAEHWARRRNQVLFVHYELDHEYMLDRRMARHTGLTLEQLEDGRLTQEQHSRVSAMRGRLCEWSGNITYVHSPGWTMEHTVSELRRVCDVKQCDAVVIDYLEKVAPSKRQIQLFGANQFQREADNVEQLKNFAEGAQIPVLMVAQMSKVGKGTSFDKLDRGAMRGAGEKSEKSNLVVLISGENDSTIVNVLVDKQTKGAKGSFQQFMEPQFYRIGDIAQ